jgi:hypothetical protein
VQELADLVEQELLEPVDPRVSDMAAAIAQVHGEASRALLFYGSCLREQQLEGLMLDFYLIVSNYRAAYPKRWLATANRLIPPNVFYFEHGGLVCKYAVLSEEDFRRECGPGLRSISVLARFAQPSRLVWRKDAQAEKAVIFIVSSAAPTLLELTLPAAGDASIGQVWKQAFSRTFGAELRAERSDRSGRLVDADPARYEQFGLAALQAIAVDRCVGSAGQVPPIRDTEATERWWRRMQRKGKWLSVLRLAKASATFAGGVDYIAWKINRHAGTQIEIKGWQRRWPLLAALTLAPRLLRSGAVR